MIDLGRINFASHAVINAEFPEEDHDKLDQLLEDMTALRTIVTTEHLQAATLKSFNNIDSNISTIAFADEAGTVQQSYSQDECNDVEDLEAALVLLNKAIDRLEGLVNV